MVKSLKSSKGAGLVSPIIADNMNSDFMNFGDMLDTQTPCLTIAPPSSALPRARTPPPREKTPSPPSTKSRLSAASAPTHSPASAPSSQASPTPSLLQSSASTPISKSPVQASSPVQTFSSPASPIIVSQFKSQHGPLLRAHSDNVPQHGALMRTSSDNVALGKARRSLSPKNSVSDLFELIAAEGGTKYVFIKRYALMPVKILFSWNDKPGPAYKVRKFAPEATVEQAVAEINSSLSEEYKSDRNKLYFNNEPLEGGKLLASYGFQISEILHFKREPQYEFSAENAKHGGTLVLDPNMVISDIIKKMLVWMLGSIPANSEQASRGYSNSSRFKLFKKLQAAGSSNHKGWGIRLMDMKRLGDYGIRKRDVLQLIVKDTVNSTDAEVPEAEAEGDGEAETEGTLKGESIYEMNVEDAPITTDVGIEEEKDATKQVEEEPPKLEKKHRRVPSLLKRTSEISFQNLVGAPYNVVHKSHVNFDYQWTGDAVAEAFEMKEKIGQGGYGAVYKAVHKETGFTMAIKALSNVNGVGRTDLQKEMDVLRKCRCNNVLSYYGSMVVKNEIWILMDLCSVGSVKDLMKTCVETLDEVQIAMIAREVLRGLAYLHERGIVHMDVKAANILLTEDGSVKLADFGVSQQLQAATSQSDVLIGSPLWMAPEIIMKNPYDHKADMWSLGITLIELAEGRAPPRGLKKIEDLITTVNLPPPSLTNPRSWSPTFLDFINKCLKKDPAERPSAINLLTHPFLEGGSGPEVLMDLIKDSTRIKLAKAEREREKAEKEREKLLGSPVVVLP